MESLQPRLDQCSVDQQMIFIFERFQSIYTVFKTCSENSRYAAQINQVLPDEN